MPKITISWCKMYKPGNSGWNQISVLPDDSITRHELFFQILVIFGFFLNFLKQYSANHIWYLAKMWHSGGLAKTCLTATLTGIVTTKVLWQIKTLMSSLVSCLLMSANNQKDDILLQQCESRKGIKQNSKVFLYILDAFFTASCFVYLYL